jgi:hypothetical protein
MTAKSEAKIKADKRAAALRDNLRKRKEKTKLQSESTKDDAKN